MGWPLVTAKVLLTSWSDFKMQDQPVAFFEIFAGCGETTKQWP